MTERQSDRVTEREGRARDGRISNWPLIPLVFFPLWGRALVEVVLETCRLDLVEVLASDSEGEQLVDRIFNCSDSIRGAG